MERKTKIELALAVSVIILFFAMLLYWLQPPGTPVVPSNNTQANIQTSGTVASSTTDQAPVVKETSAVTVARTFVERLGSYSSEADAANLDDILGMATQSFQSQLTALARQARSSATGTYYGISTLVITAPKVVTASDTETTLSMTTQREETKDTPGNTTIVYQDISVTLVKSGTTWLVSGYSWK